MPARPGQAPSFDQPAALAQFGAFALKADDLDAVLQEACRLASAACQAPLSMVVELQGDGQSLLVRAGMGWKPGVVGTVRVEAGERTAERHALRAAMPVVSADIEAEGRFDCPGFVKDHGLRALAAVPIAGADGAAPYGVLQVGSPVPRDFTDADTQVLRGYATLLAAAIERHRALEGLRRRAEEKERLLQELQHRVTNNMQTVMGLVRRAVRGSQHPETAAGLRAVGNGIEAMRMVHDKIYRMEAGSDRTCLGAYLTELAASLLAFHGKDVAARVRLVCDVVQVPVPSDVAIPFGLIASEFITNSLKYAFGEGEGQIGLRVEDEGGGRLRVSLWDDGKGFPDAQPSGTGIRLIGGLARQVGGTAEWVTNDGTRLVVSLPALPARH